MSKDKTKTTPKSRTKRSEPADNTVPGGKAKLERIEYEAEMDKAVSTIFRQPARSLFSTVVATIEEVLLPRPNPMSSR